MIERGRLLKEKQRTEDKGSQRAHITSSLFDIISIVSAIIYLQ